MVSSVVENYKLLNGKGMEMCMYQILLSPPFPPPLLQSPAKNSKQKSLLTRKNSVKINFQKILSELSPSLLVAQGGIESRFDYLLRENSDFRKKCYSLLATGIYHFIRQSTG